MAVASIYQEILVGMHMVHIFSTLRNRHSEPNVRKICQVYDDILSFYIRSLISDFLILLL